MPKDWNIEASAERKAAFLRHYSVLKDVKLACLEVPIQQSTVRQWVRRDVDFAKAYFEAGGAHKLPNSTKVAEAEGFPFDDFLKWRELTCAYRDHRTKRWVRAVNNWYQRDAYRQLQEHNRLIVVLPPGHIKTTFFAIEYPTWRIEADRNTRVVAIQKNQDEAKKLVSSVQERLSDSDYYDFIRARLIEQGDEPILNPLSTWFERKPFKADKRAAGDTWGAYTFKVMGRTSGEKDSTMEGKGVGGQIQGVRADLIVLDDVQDPAQAVKSVQDSEDKLRWFKDVILGRVTEAQQVVVLANYFSPDDFAHKLIEANPEFAVVEYPALIDFTLNPEIPLGETAPLCPEFWTTEALAFKKTEVGEQTWYYTWMQESGSYEDATFKREVLMESRRTEVKVGEVPHSVTDIFLGVDPAIAASGYCSMVLWGLDRRTKQRWMIDVFNETGMRNWDNVAAQILQFCRRYSIRSVIIERNNTQQSLAFNPMLEREVRSTGAKIVTYQTVTGTGGRAEISNFDITTIGGLFDAGLVSVCYGGTFEDQAKIDHYIDQLCAWRTDDQGHSVKHLTRDMVMATLFAESEAFELARREANPGKPKKVYPSGRGQWSGRRALSLVRGKPEDHIDTLSGRSKRRGPLKVRGV